jgi:hypothetical protein
MEDGKSKIENNEVSSIFHLPFTIQDASFSVLLVPWNRDDLHKSRSAAPAWQGAKSEFIGHK